MSILRGFKRKKTIPSDSVVPEVIHRAEKLLSAPGGVILLRTATELKVTEVPMSTSGIGGGLFAFLCQKEGAESAQNKQPGTRGRVLREKNTIWWENFGAFEGRVGYLGKHCLARSCLKSASGGASPELPWG